MTTPVLAQTADPRFVSSADYTFGQSLHFYLSGGKNLPIEKVSLFFQAPEFPNTFVAQFGNTPDGRQISISHEINLTQVQLAPFTTITYWWLVQTSEGDIQIPAQTLHYEDNQFTWHEQKQNNVLVHWTGDDLSLGQLGQDIVNESLLRLQTFVPLVNSAPLEIYIYPTTADLRAALRLTGRDWVGAHTSPELGVILVTAVNLRTAPTDLRQSLPHELTHQLLYRATLPNYNSLPLWFNEGLASLMETTPNPNYQSLLATAVANRATLPFHDLCLTFPSDESQAILAYAQSRDLLQYIQTQYGTNTIRDLVQAFGEGLNCQNAVQRVLQKSLDALDQEWLNNLQPRSTMSEFWQNNALWLLLLLGGFGITGLLVLNPKP